MATSQNSSDNEMKDAVATFQSVVYANEQPKLQANKENPPIPSKAPIPVMKLLTIPIIKSFDIDQLLDVYVADLKIFKKYQKHKDNLNKGSWIVGKISAINSNSITINPYPLNSWVYDDHREICINKDNNLDDIYGYKNHFAPLNYKTIPICINKTPPSNFSTDVIVGLCYTQSPIYYQDNNTNKKCIFIPNISDRITIYDIKTDTFANYANFPPFRFKNIQRRWVISNNELIVAEFSGILSKRLLRLNLNTNKWTVKAFKSQKRSKIILQLFKCLGIIYDNKADKLHIFGNNKKDEFQHIIYDKNGKTGQKFTKMKIDGIPLSKVKACKVVHCEHLNKLILFLFSPTLYSDIYHFYYCDLDKIYNGISYKWLKQKFPRVIKVNGMGVGQLRMNIMFKTVLFFQYFVDIWFYDFLSIDPKWYEVCGLFPFGDQSFLIYSNDNYAYYMDFRVGSCFNFKLFVWNLISKDMYDGRKNINYGIDNILVYGYIRELQVQNVPKSIADLILHHFPSFYD